MISSPIAMLPPELMRCVISFAAAHPCEHYTILSLSQVSQSFRQTVLDMSWLFTQADWDHWPTPLLDLWCQRARAQSLTVNLPSLTVHRLTVGEAPELKALLESYSQHWGTLTFWVLPERSDEYERSIRFVERLLQCACPLLHTIDGWAPPRPFMNFTTTLHLHPDCLPSLHKMHMRNISFAFPTSPTSVTELEQHCSYPERWLPLLDGVKSCRLIQKLTINTMDYYGGNSITFPAASGKVVLPSLTVLELRGLAPVSVAPAISQLLSCCDIPKLESLIMWVAPRSGGPGVFKNLCQDLVRR